MFSFVRSAAFALSLALATGAAAPQTPEPAAEQAAVPTPAEELDALFAELAAAPAEGAAARIARRIEAHWLDSGSATVDLFMQRATEAASRFETGAALDFLDQVTLLAPDFAEAYNRRAGLHFLAGRAETALADIERTLALEPRHYRALFLLGLVLESLDRNAEALDAYERSLAIYPTADTVLERLEALRPEVEGRPI